MLTDDFFFDHAALAFDELESRYGRDSAYAILRILEQFEGISDPHVVEMSGDDRLRNVVRSMRENTGFQTRH